MKETLREFIYDFWDNAAQNCKLGHKLGWHLGKYGDWNENGEIPGRLGERRPSHCKSNEGN